MAQKKKNLPKLTLHRQLVALSFWGSSVRILLFTFLAAAVLAALLINDSSTIEAHVSVFIYIVGSFVLLDAGYVMIARALALKRRLDTLVLLMVELLITVAFLVPVFVYAPGLSKLSVWTVLIVLLTLATRALLGLLFARPRK